MIIIYLIFALIFCGIIGRFAAESQVNYLIKYVIVKKENRFYVKERKKTFLFFYYYVTCKCGHISEKTAKDYIDILISKVERPAPKIKRTTEVINKYYEDSKVYVPTKTMYPDI
jgi:hypothetical protein